LDSSGNIYTLLPLKCAIVKLDKATGTASTFFGTMGTCGSGANQLGYASVVSLASGICIDRPNNKLYVVGAMPINR
jgi:hypothetical protein